MFFKLGALKNFENFSGKIPVLESLYKKVGLKILIRFQHKRFPMKFAAF